MPFLSIHFWTYDCIRQVEHNRNNLMKKRHKIALSILTALVAIRIALPYVIKYELNKTLASLPEYQGHVDDVDLALYKGAIAFNNFILDKAQTNDTIPFIGIQRTEFGIDFNALINGAFVGNIKLTNPNINFIAAKDTTQQQYGGDYSWFKPIAELRPMEINRLTVEGGNVHFQKFDSSPDVDLMISNITLEANNLRNVVDKSQKLPSSFQLSANVLNGGRLNTSAEMNILKDIPDLSLNFKLEDVAIENLNDFLLTYGKFDASSGELNFYSELAVDSHQIDGYFKPLISDFKVSNWQENKRKPGKLVFESAIDLFIVLLRNQKENQFASKIPISGNVENSKVSYLATLKNVLVNAFVKAYDKDIDNTVTYPLKST